jgi:isoleucyl-tRNA synthetase
VNRELRLAGLLCEIIRLVQDGRKNGGLEVSDRIELWWRIGESPDPAEVIRTHQDRFAAEVLATSVHEGEPGFETRVQVSDTELGLQVWARRA